jgi:hypothetical protein
MTLLSISQEILRQTKSASIPSTIYGNNQPAAVQVLEVLNRSVKSLSRSYDWQELTKEHTFSAVISQNNYSLPSDFDRIVNNTFWNTTDNREMLGSVSGQEWRTLTDSTAGSGGELEYYRIRANEVLIFPTPTATDNYIFEYISKNIVESSGGSGQSTWLADTDVSVIDEYILKLDATWRLLKSQGRPYAEDQREANLALAERMGINAGRRTIRHGYINFINGKIAYPNNITP